MDAVNALSVPNIVFALVGASGAGIILLVLMRRGWDVNLQRSASSIEELAPQAEGAREQLEAKLRQAGLGISAEEFVRASLIWGLVGAVSVQAIVGYWGL